MYALITCALVIGALLSVPVFLADMLERNRRNRELDKIIELVKEIDHE